MDGVRSHAVDWCNSQRGFLILINVYFLYALRTRGAGLVWRPSRGHPWAWSIGREGKTSVAWYRFLAVCAHQRGESGAQWRRASDSGQPLQATRNCHNQRRRTESNPYNPWTGGNHQVSRVGWDEESGDDEGGHLHQGPHLILRQGVARVWWSTW